MTRLAYAGHATILIEMDGVRLLTDPVLRRRAGALRRRQARIDPDWSRAIDTARAKAQPSASGRDAVWSSRSRSCSVRERLCRESQAVVRASDT